MCSRRNLEQQQYSGRWRISSEGDTDTTMCWDLEEWETWYQMIGWLVVASHQKGASASHPLTLVQHEATVSAEQP